MFKFILKRLGISAVIMLISSAIMYVLTINSGDPLRDLRESNDPNRENLIAQRTQWMGLDQPWTWRDYTRETGAFVRAAPMFRAGFLTTTKPPARTEPSLLLPHDAVACPPMTSYPTSGARPVLVGRHCRGGGN